MADIEVNLTGLSEKELLHIKEVLSRDRKLQDSKRLIRPPDNDNCQSTKKPVPANELVMAEIERVSRQSPNSYASGRTSPARSDSESNEDGFFASFADMITRGMEAIDLTRNHKKGPSALSALAGAVMKMDTTVKMPFSYNPRQTERKKPTLLELAASRRSSTPPISMTLRVDENENLYKRSRNDVMFSSWSVSQTLPRSYGRRRPESPISGKTPIRSPRLLRKCNSTAPTSTQAKTPTTPSKTAGVSPSKCVHSPVKDEVKSPEKQTTKRVSSDSQKKEPETSPVINARNKETSPVKRPDVLPTISALVYPQQHSTDNGKIMTETIEETPQKHTAISTQSQDSGIYSKPEFFMRKYDNDSPLEDDAETGQNNIYDYEPDTESVYDADSRRFTDYADDVSLNSVSSSFLESPMRRPLGDLVQDSWDESDASSGVFVNQLGVAKNSNDGHLIKHVSPGSHKPHWVNSREKRRPKKNPRPVSTGYDKLMAQSPASSPSLSTRSVPYSDAASPILRQDSSQSTTDMDTIGHLDISLVYYSADSFARKKMSKTDIPSYGTKSQTEKSCHVLSRREYVEVTDAELELSEETKSGASKKMDGELHLIVKGAKFQDSNGKIKAPNTYVKCYLLPDKFHNSKMKSSVIKKSKEPQWDHKFVLAGFTQSELRARSLEIIVGSWHFKKQEVLGGAILSIGQGSPSQPWIKSTKSEAYVWKTALQISGNKVKSLLPLRAHMKPTYL